MHRDHLHAGCLSAARQFWRIEGAFVPTEPHLQCHRYFHRRDGRLDQLQGVVQIAHQSRAGLASGHVARRAAHVDIDDFSAGGFGDPRAFRHPADLAARELNDVWTNACRLAPQPRHRAAVDEIIARRHLGDHEASAKRCRQTSKWRIGDARHRSEKNRIGDINIAYLQRLGVLTVGACHGLLICLAAAPSQMQKLI